METEPKLGWRKDLPLDHKDVAPVIAGALGSKYAHVMVERTFGNRHHLRLHRTRDGRLYVRIGRRGSGKGFIDRCDVTYFDGEPTLHEFKFVKGEWEIRAEQRLAAEDARIAQEYGL